MVQGPVVVEERVTREDLAGVGAEGRPILLFDGSCYLCHSAVRFIATRDRKGVVRYAFLQSGTGRGLLRNFGLPAQDSSSLVLVEGQRVYRKSGAVLRLLRLLNRCGACSG